jgi:hypothetical protein
MPEGRHLSTSRQGAAASDRQWRSPRRRACSHILLTRAGSASRRLEHKRHGHASRTTVGDEHAFLARRSEFRWEWVGIRMHTFVVVFSVGELAPDRTRAFPAEAQAHAIKHKGGLPRGLQTRIATIAVVINDSADEDSVHWFKHEPRYRCAALLLPVLARPTISELVYSRAPGRGATLTAITCSASSATSSRRRSRPRPSRSSGRVPRVRWWSACETTPIAGARRPRRPGRRRPLVDPFLRRDPLSAQSETLLPWAELLVVERKRILAWLLDSPDGAA